MFVIGITGGIGCGKSTAADYFRQRGVTVIDADEISHRVTAPGGAAVEEILAHFGPAVQAGDGAIARSALAELVFRDRRALDDLSLIVHAHVIRSIRAEYQQHLEAKERILVLDVPIPVEEGFLDLADQVLIIWAADEVRYKRLEQRGLSREDAAERIAAQMTKEEYEALGDLTIDNSGDRKQLLEALDRYVIDHLHKRGLRLPKPSRAPENTETAGTENPAAEDIDA